MADHNVVSKTFTFKISDTNLTTKGSAYSVSRMESEVYTSVITTKSGTITVVGSYLYLTTEGHHKALTIDLVTRGDFNGMLTSEGVDI